MSQGITKDTKPVKIVSRKMSDGECHELDCRNARFGLSLANLGDLDGDGFNGTCVRCARVFVVYVCSRVRDLVVLLVLYV